MMVRFFLFSFLQSIAKYKHDVVNKQYDEFGKGFYLPTHTQTYFALNVEYKSPWAEMASPSPTVCGGCLHTSTGLR